MLYRDKYKLREKERRKVLRARKFIKEIKGNGCLIYGYSKCTDALSFHHIGNDKDRDVNRIYSKEKAIKEKCILVYNNCHAEIHSKDRKMWTNGNGYIFNYLLFKGHLVNSQGHI